MKNTIRTLAVVAGITALAASSQAVITFSSYTSDFNVSSANQISATPSQLSNFVFGAGPVSDTGNFDVSATHGLDELEVTEVDGFAVGGTLSLTVTLYNGATVASGVEDVLYTGTDSGGPLTPIANVTLLSPVAAGTHYVSYVATFTGSSSAALGYLGGFAVNAYEPVPEPASFATVGVGIIVLLARRRRSSK